MTEPVIGWDLGGAHLKAARLGRDGTVEQVVQLSCPLWQGIEHLTAAVDQALSRLGAAPVHAITMTGEMVDLFPDRREGVVRIAARVQKWLGPAQCRYFAGASGFVTPEAVAGAALQIASANWRATAEMVARLAGEALLVDVGSTTTDIIALVNGQVATDSDNDAERLVSQELVYAGVVRTPVMALARVVQVEGQDVPMMAEYFSTSADVYRLTGEMPDGADLHPAADSGEKTLEASARRLARMVGRDAMSANPAIWAAMARELARAQTSRVAEAMSVVASRARLPAQAPVVMAGVGRFVAAKAAAAVGRPSREFHALLPAAAGLSGLVSDCAPAVAVAWLAGRAAG